MRILVAGIGNVFLGDDGFGVEVINHLDAAAFGPDVVVGDYGIRGIHLAYDLLDGDYDLIVLVDAVPLGEPPGTLALLEVDSGDLGTTEFGEAAMVAHAMTPHTVLRSLRDLGGRIGRSLVVGCQPGTLDEGIGLSAPVAAAVEPACRLVISTVDSEASMEVQR